MPRRMTVLATVQPMMLAHLALFVIHATGTDMRAAETPPARPNVLFIAVDDLNDWINCIGK